MVTDSDGYHQLIEYLTENLHLFEQSNANPASHITVLTAIEEELSEQIMIVCDQNKSISFTNRSILIREIDAIVYDLQEILSSVANHKVTDDQLAFIKEFSLLIKNLFDNEVQKLPKES